MEKYLPTQLIGPTRLLISEKTFTYTIIRSYTIIWQVRVCKPVKSLIQIKIENQSDKVYDLFLEEFEKLVKLTDLFQTNGIFVR